MKNRTELAKYFAKLGFKKGAEIGVFKGRYSEVLLKEIPNLSLLCIDNWSGRRLEKEIYPEAVKRLSEYPSVKIIRMRNREAAKLIEDESLDFVFIDANHYFNNVLRDIERWTKKVKRGGIVSGHDYLKEEYEHGPAQAVDEYVKKHNLKLYLTDWDYGNPERDDRQPCWYFIKP